MKAIRVSSFGEPSVLELHETADLKPGPGQVLVRLHAAGVNPVETYIRAGNYPKLPALPYTPGQDGAGIVLAVGERVRNWQPGHSAYLAGSLTGTYAEQALCMPEQLHSLPESISFEQGAALGVPYGTAWRALFQRGKAAAGEIVLVHGASGGVGTAAVQLAHGAGLRVFGTAGSEAGLEHVRANGAEAAFNHHEAGYLEKIKEATAGVGLDLILEMLANRNLGADLTLLARHGRVAVIGSRGPVEIDPRDTMMREADIRGVTIMGVNAEETAEIYAGIDHALAEGKARPVIGAAVPLAEAARAHELIHEKTGATGKIVLTM